MNEELTTPSASSDQTSPSKYKFQPFLPTEVNIDRPAITLEDAYQVYQKVGDGVYCYPEDTPRSPTVTPFQGAQGTVIMYTRTPHGYHDQLGPTAKGFDKHTLDHLEAHFEDGSVFGERMHIQTTGGGTAEIVTVFTLFAPMVSAVNGMPESDVGRSNRLRHLRQTVAALSDQSLTRSYRWKSRKNIVHVYPDRRISCL
jgi:hypothetical protein